MSEGNAQAIYIGSIGCNCSPSVKSCDNLYFTVYFKWLDSQEDLLLENQT